MLGDYFIETLAMQQLLMQTILIINNKENNMQTIAVFGAASGLGSALIESFHKKNFNVIGIARKPDNSSSLAALKIKTVTCDATAQAQVQAAVEELPADAWVISTMGSFNTDTPVDYIGHRYLINALEQKNINRFLMITSLGCGDSWQYLSERSKAAFGSAIREKSLAESWLQSSQLEFTILRPGGLMNGEITGNGKLSQGIEAHGLISRNEVAELVHQLLENKESIGQTYECVDSSVTY